MTRTNDVQLDALRIPPQSIEAEQSVLGSLLRDNNAWFLICDRISAEDFYRHEHRLIFNAIQMLIESGRPADVLTVSKTLAQRDNGSDGPEFMYLDSMARDSASTANIARYADIVRDRCVLRELITAANDICENAYKMQDGDITALLDSAESQILAIGGKRTNGVNTVVQLDVPVFAVVDEIDAAYSSDDPGPTSGTLTGFSDLDRMTSGMQDGDLIVVAGRPSMGKTALALGIGMHVAIEANKSVLMFTLETGAKQLAQRMISAIAGIDQQRMRRGSMHEDDWPLLTSAIQQLGKKPIYIDDTAGLTATEVRARARRFAKHHGKPGLVIIDYLQLMAGSHRNTGTSETRAAEMAGITRSLKNLAKELGCPVIALSQVNRTVESRLNKRPVLTDLRDSGSIEDDADVIVFLYRDEVYNLDSPDKGIAEVIIAKQRSGPIGTIWMIWQGIFGRFADYVRPQ